MELVQQIWEGSGLYQLTVGQFAMICICLLLLYLGIAKKFEPLLLVTHGCVFKATLAHLLGWRGGYWLELRCGTCMRVVRKSATVHSFTHLIHPEEMRLD
jgi:hypothetical protein